MRESFDTPAQNDEESTQKVNPDYRDVYAEAYGKEKFSKKELKQTEEDLAEFAAGLAEMENDLKSRIEQESAKENPDNELLVKLNEELTEIQNEMDGAQLWNEHIASGEIELHDGFRQENDAAFQETIEKDIRKKLESQFDNPDKVELADGTILDVVDLNPGQNNLKDETPVIMIQGLSQDARPFKENMVLMGLAGRRVFAVNMPYGSDIKNLPADIFEKTKNVPEIERRKVATLYNAVAHIRKKTGTPSVKAVTHSEGSIILTETAQASPDWFSDAILVEPAGLTEPTEPEEKGGAAHLGKVEELTRAAKLTGGGLADLVLENVRTQRAQIEKKHNLSLSDRLIEIQKRLGIINPKGFDPKFAKENQAISKENAARSTQADRNRIIGAIPIIARYQIGPIMKNLRQNHKMQFVVVGGVNDWYFDVKKMSAASRSDMMDGSLSVKGTHGQMSSQPIPYTAAIDNAFDNLQKKREKNANFE